MHFDIFPGPQVFITSLPQANHLSSDSINHWVLHSLLIMILALELFFSGSQALCLVLYMLE